MNSENKPELGPNDTTTKTKKNSVKNACCGIYGLRNKVNGKWYVGQSKDIHNRWHKAYENLDCSSQPKIYNALLKYGYEQFEKIILEEFDGENWVIDYREMYWIRYMNSVSCGYNIREGGRSWNKDTTTRVSLYNSFPKHMLKYNIDWKNGNRIFTDEWKKNISIAKKGIPTKKHTEETKNKMRLIAIEREKKKRSLFATSQTL